ncbi:MAG: CPBP family intramembrane metalloprotease [Treponema sp.]|jgi:membrane protease YdiL (CAAX protease family)|nr:CPBP family intramembrane metalloprotease [Treponema sp.]
MGAYIEALILYLVLFFSGTAGRTPPEEIIPFSIVGELARIVLYNIPSLALIWYLLLKSKSLKSWGIGPPGRKDLLPGLLTLPALILIGFIIALVSPYLGGVPAPGIAPPASVPAWIVLALSCLSTGYLEESFFRFYLLSKREELGLGASRAALLSALLFSLCHLYEGPWGFLNAVLSGVTLAFVFLRYRSFHGIALAHGLYNIFVYILGAL